MSTNLSKSELLNKRRDILHQIENLKSSLCEKCSTANYSEVNNTRCNCQAAKDTRKLGEQLMKLVSPRNNEFKPVYASLKTFSVESYIELKEQGLMDMEIVRMKDFNNCTFKKWKRENNLIGKGLRRG